MSSPPEIPPRPGYPRSPCNRVCTLNDARVCLGCKRTVEEIMAWSTMSAEQQWEVVRELQHRIV